MTKGSITESRLPATYLHLRWYWGSGLLLLPAISAVTGYSVPRGWAMSAAGAIVLVHAVGMAILRLEALTSTLFMDLLIVHGALLLMSIDGLDHSVVLLTIVGASVLTSMYSSGVVQMAALALNAAFGLANMAVADLWDLSEVVAPFLGALFLVGLVAVAIDSFKRRVSALEDARALTLGIASHELRNRLTGVIGVAQLLNEGGVAPDSEEGRELIEMIHREAVEAGAVIEDLLTVSRTERGTLETTPEPMDLAEIVRNVVATFHRDGDSISVKGADRPVWVMGDPLRAPQVLRNLLTNADRYGGSDVRVVLSADGDMVSVMVSDNGDGVHPNDVPNLFTPYHRAKGREPVHGSTGLGLWISRNLMRSMGGDLTYRRVDDRTVFEAVFRETAPPDQS
jgi:signal transduction histidine kinase